MIRTLSCFPGIRNKIENKEISMKKTILSLFLILCGGCQLFADFQVAKDGIPFAEIIVPAEEPEPVKNAAEEMQL